MRTRAILASCAGALLLAVAAGCGEDDPGTPAVIPTGDAGEGGTLTWAVADRPRTLDPLAAQTRAELILTRQIHEPLIETLAGPFGDVRRRPGLARSARPSADGEVWLLRLRSGVRFQDGSLFDAAAVQANAERWLASEVGRELLPDLVAVDAPSPSSVRFLLDEPDPDLPRRLAAPALGIVSPRALAAGFDGTAILRREPFAGTGTGAFELREVEADRLLLARNTAWWGATERLGPALEQVVLRTERSGAVRVALLDSGDAQLADELDADQARFVRRNPLLAAIEGPDGRWLGLERSVRGIDAATEIPSLSSAWLTAVRVPD